MYIKFKIDFDRSSVTNCQVDSNMINPIESICSDYFINALIVIVLFPRFCFNILPCV